MLSAEHHYPPRRSEVEQDATHPPYASQKINALLVDRIDDEEMWARLKVQPQSLSFTGEHGSFKPDAIRPELLRGVQRLSIHTHICHRSNMPVFRDQLPLTALEVDHHYPLPRSLFDSLIAASPNLTMLSIDCNYSAFPPSPDYSLDALTTVASRLRHLTLRFQLRRGGDEFPTLVSDLLLDASSLQVLTVESLSPTGVLEVLSSVTVPLVALTTHFPWNEHLPLPKSTVTAAELIQLFDLPSMQVLKRWRLCAEDNRIPLGGLEEVRRWCRACEARGVEARDETTYFTD